MTSEFGWSRSVFVAASSIGTVMGGLLALAVGPAIDRYGARWVIFAGFLVMGGLTMAMGSIHSIWQFYVILIATRMILQGVLNLANNVVVAKWFYRKRSIALAISRNSSSIESITPKSAPTSTLFRVPPRRR